MRITARTDYALRAAVELAAAEPGVPVKAERLADAQKVPLKFLENILASLRHAGLVESRRGPEGGYLLARPPEEITLADILAAVDGPLTALMEEHDHCEGHCILQEVWVGVSDEMRTYLEGYTLADLVERTKIGHPDAG